MGEVQSALNEVFHSFVSDFLSDGTMSVVILR